MPKRITLKPATEKKPKKKTLKREKARAKAARKKVIPPGFEEE